MAKGSFVSNSFDPTLKAKIDRLSPDSGASVAAGAEVYFNIGGVNTAYLNPTASAINVPATINAANLTSAGFIKSSATPTSANTISGNGAPTAAIGQNGEYYRQLDAAIGAFRVWGPKASGSWPASATLEVTPDPGNAQTYAFTRTDTSTAVPTAVEIANPKVGDIANVRLSDGTVLIFKHDGTNWALLRTDSAAGVDSVARTAIAAISPASGATVPVNGAAFLSGKLWENKTAAAITVPATINDANLTTAGLTVVTVPVVVNEVVLSNSNLTGAAPVGAKYGRNVTTGAEFDVVAGNWAAAVTAGATLNQAVALANLPADTPTNVTFPGITTVRSVNVWRGSVLEDVLVERTSANVIRLTSSVALTGLSVEAVGV